MSSLGQRLSGFHSHSRQAVQDGLAFMLSTCFLSSPPTSSPLQVICIIVKNESDVSAFSNYQPSEQGGGATPPPSEPPQQVRVKSDYADNPVSSLATLCLLCNGRGREGWSTPHCYMCNHLWTGVTSCHHLSSCHMALLVTLCHIQCWSFSCHSSFTCHPIITA